MKTWLSLLWLVTFAGWDWMDGVKGDKLFLAAKSPPQAAGHEPTEGEEANKGTLFPPHTHQEDDTGQEEALQTREGPEQALGKGTEEGGEKEGQETQQGVVQAGPGREECAGCRATSSMAEGEGEVNDTASMHDLRGVPDKHGAGFQSTKDAAMEQVKKPAKELDKEPDKELAKEPSKEQDKEPVKESDKEPTKEQDKEPAKESDKEPAKEQDKEPAKESDKEPTKEQDKEPAKESDKEPAKEQDKEPTKEQDKEPTKECEKEPAKEQDKEPAKEQDKQPAKECDKQPVKEPTKKPTAAPTTEATTAPTTAPQRCPPSNPWDTCGDDATEIPEVATALTDFALKFYSTAAKVKGSGTNMVFSPLSVALALSQLLLGARGETKERLESILAYPPDLVCLHAPLGQLLKSKAMSIASKLFVRQGLHLNDTFVNQSKRFYNSRPRVLSGNETQDLWHINKWVADVTHGKIKKLLKELDPHAELVLLNAVYFQSKWKMTFKVKNTKAETFYRPGKDPIRVPMMISKKYPLASFTDHSLQVKVGRLQLSHNMSLVVIMPLNLAQTLAEVEQKLTKETFAAVMKKLMGSPFKPTVVSLPRLKLDSSQDLMDILGEMDYGVFFDANLCGISETEDLQVTRAQHRAVLELNEEGVEAAAATVLSVARTAWIFDVQQPFLFVLWNDEFSFPVFMGHVNDPSV
ncbi:plasma protease C1 inhibitor [Emydura macquarii macquarii]|uniref:plasma protease C1 inhibitor n=1 Tax=Emydura macquarii macquarii TaxID=1129001 RepID=UPI003529FB09